MHQLTPEQARADVLKTMCARLDETKKELAALSDAPGGRDYIVRCQGLPLEFKVIERLVRQPRVTNASGATRFTQQDAARVAADVSNGNSVKGEAVHIRDHLMQDIGELQALLARIEEGCK